MLVLSEATRQRWQDHDVQASLSYTVQSCLKTQNKTKQIKSYLSIVFMYCKPVVPVLGRQGHEDIYQFKDTLSYTVNSRPV